MRRSVEPFIFLWNIHEQEHILHNIDIQHYAHKFPRVCVCLMVRAYFHAINLEK